MDRAGRSATSVPLLHQFILLYWDCKEEITFFQQGYICTATHKKEIKEKFVSCHLSYGAVKI